MNLFAEFPPVTAEQWDEVIVKDLKGADYDKKLVWKTPEGFNVRPFYSAKDLDGLAHLKYAPGEFPYVRGVRSDNKWKVAQAFTPDSRGVAIDNASILDALMRGVDSIVYKVKSEGLSDSDFEILTRGILLPHVEINFKTCCSDNAKKLIEQVIAKAKSEKWDAKEIKGSINYDPLRKLTLKGTFGANGNAFESVKALIEASETLPQFRPVGVNPYIFQNAGSTIVQELAFGLAMGNEYLAQLSDMGLDAAKVAAKLRFTFAVSSNYFAEIAKFRAARMLWAEIVKAYGETSCCNKEKCCGTKMKIHALTSGWNQTVYDAHVNILRGTTEAMSAALAGVDSLEVTPFDAPYAGVNDFSSRISRNTQLLLKEESYFDRVTDPSAGSYYIENLTASIAAEAWKLFREIEDKGGYIASFKEGYIQSLVKASAQKKNASIATRRDTLLGTNQYPNFTERLGVKTIDAAAQEKKCCCGCEKTETEPIEIYRGSMAFENLRFKTEKSGKTPKTFMLTFGNLAMCRARAQFSCNFFACAGFDVIDNNRFASIDEGVNAAMKIGADIVVACSSDDEYTDSVPAIAQQLAGKAILVVAGEPACKPELEAKGITHFISMKSNVLETLKEYQKELKID